MRFDRGSEDLHRKSGRFDWSVPSLSFGLHGGHRRTGNTYRRQEILATFTRSRAKVAVLHRNNRVAIDLDAGDPQLKYKRTAR